MVCIIAWTHLSERIIPALGRSRPGKHGCYPALSALKQLPVPKETSLERLRKIGAYDMNLLGEAMNFVLL